MAATALSSQLQALAGAGGQLTTTKARTKASLLYSPSQAADVDLQTIFSLAQSGLDDLVNMERRFEPYKKTLFSSESLNLDRELQSRELNDKLNISIANFLQLLCSYVLHKPAHQALEYLIRRYKIHIYNVDELVISVLPYHETGIFVRIVQLLQLKKTKWEFLEGVKKKGVAPPRSTLVHRCMTDMAILDALCESAIKVKRMPSKSRTIISFTSIIVVEMLAAVPSVTTSIINKILPFVMHSFEAGVTEEYRVGGLMVVGTLANRTPLSSSLVETLLNAMATIFQKESEVKGAPLLQLSLMVMIQFMQVLQYKLFRQLSIAATKIEETQDMDIFPTKAFKFLLKVRNFYEMLAKLVLMYDASKFISLFLGALVQHSALHEHYEQALVAVIQTVTIKDNIAQLLRSILELYIGGGAVEGAEQDSARAREVAKRLLKILERRFPAELDSAISACLQEGKGAEKGNKANLQQQALHDIFLGSPHMFLAESNNTLYLSLDHPEARIREAAVRQLAELDQVPESDDHSEMKNMLCEALLRRAHDDDYSVLRAVLSVKSFIEAPFPDRLFKLLVLIITKCLKTIHTGSKVQQAEAKGTASLALKVLASRFLELHPSFADQVAAFLFSHLLISPKTLKLNMAALNLAGHIPYLLFEGFSQMQDALPGLKEGTKNQKEELRLACNEKVVSSVAACVLKQIETSLPVLLEASAIDERAKCLVLLVLSHVIKENSRDHFMHIVNTCLPWLQNEWASVESEDPSSLLTDPQKIDYKGDRNTIETYHLLDTQPNLLNSQLLLKILYQLLELVPINFKGEPNLMDKMLKEFYKLFVSVSVMDKFAPHIRLLLTYMSTNLFPFVSQFLTWEGSQASSRLHSHSLDLLASHFKHLATGANVEGNKVESLTPAQLQEALPSLVVGLADPVQVVRRSAADCLEQLYALSEKFHSTSGTEWNTSQDDVLPPNTFNEVLKFFVEAKAACTSNELFVATLLASLTEFDKTLPTKNESRFQPSAHKAIVKFFLAHALRLSIGAQGTLFVVLQSTGHEVEQIGATAEILEQLLERRMQCHLQTSPNPNANKLTSTEVDLLNILLHMYSPQAATALRSSGLPTEKGGQYFSNVIKALQVESGSTSDPAVLKPCLAALGCLTPEFFSNLPLLVQEQVFQALIDLSPSTCSEIHAAAHTVLQNLKIPAKIISKYLWSLCNQDEGISDTPAKKKRRVKQQKIVDLKTSLSTPEQQLAHAASVLEILSWLTDLDDRQELVLPLYELLKCTQSGKWLSPILKSSTIEATQDMSAPSINVDYIQQLILITLERLATSVLTDSNEKAMGNFDIALVVECVATTSDAATRNQALMLLTAIAKVFPDKVLKHVVDILSILGTTTITQNDTYSHEVSQELLVAIIPCWLVVGKDPTTLLQVITTALPGVPSHRRMALVTTLLRVMKEIDSLHLFLLLLLRGAAVEINGGQLVEEDKNDHHVSCYDHWKVKFAEELCQQYEPYIWLPALLKLLKVTPANLVPLATKFVASQLQSLPVDGSQSVLQEASVSLLEQALVQLQSDNKEVQILSIALLDTLTAVMAPTTYLEGMASLLHHQNPSICRKVLKLYTTRMKIQEEAGEQRQTKKKVNTVKKETKKNIVKENELQVRMLSQITLLLSGSTEDASSTVKLAAVEALEKCAKRLANTSYSGALVDSLSAVVTTCDSQRKALCIASVHCLTTLICILGPRCLPYLPSIISRLLTVGKETLLIPANVIDGSELVVSILKALESIMEKMGAFLSPYLADIISFVVLQPSIMRSTDVNVTTRASILRAVIPEKIPARLLLDPLISAYKQALGIGEESVSGLFQMLALLSSKLDRASVSLYYSRIFNICLQALDLRHNKPESLTSVAGVETWVVTALVSLVLKLSENSFKPLFINLLEWAQTGKGDSLSGRHIDQNIAFYRLINQLTEKLRSLFVPYFSYLLDGCILNLTGGRPVGDADSVQPKKKKKAAEHVTGTVVSLSEWHLRYLVLSALHKCFLHDTVSFLDAPKFQQLLRPIVAQLLVDAPFGLSNVDGDKSKDEGTATLEDMDGALISCLGQMALTAGTDLLWKPLNHEVLMCSRSEKTRPRLLALRVVKLLAEQLKEEYLVLLPETLPFLAELLEDSDLNVQAKTQEIVKFLEDLSGEDLSQYF